MILSLYWVNCYIITKNYLIFSPKIGVRKTKPIFVKIISNLRKIISNVI